MGRVRGRYKAGGKVGRGRGDGVCANVSLML